MKLSKIKFNISILLVFFLCCNLFVYSQQNDCPTGSENWQTNSYTYTISYYSAGASVNYSSQNNGQNGIDMKIDWSTLNINNAPTTKVSAWKKILVQNIVKSLVFHNAPQIEGYQMTVNYYYEKQCSTTTKFVYALDLTTQVICCSDPNIAQNFYDYWDGTN